MMSTIARRAVLMIVLTSGVKAPADEPTLRSVINEHLSATHEVEPRRCSDAEFMRRVSLDLVGMPPTSDEARAFLADRAPDKRKRLVDRLFASPHYARHLATTLDVMLMERRPNTHVSADEWQAWLLKSVQENKPWNVLVREILLADGDDPNQRPAARFALDRQCDPHVLTRDIGRLFFGRDLQCAQCHDHPLVEDYLQSDYHGLLAFVAADYPVIEKEGDKEITVRGEKAGSDAQFESVFVGAARRTKPRMPGEVSIEEPFFLPGEEYEAPPADNAKAVPKFSRHRKLADLATDGTNNTFNRAIANRLWAHMFGRGLVHPLDLHFPHNPPQYPELLQELADRFVAMGFDIRGFLREIALCDVYQRAFDPPTQLLALADSALCEVDRLEAQCATLEKTSDASAEAYDTALAAWQEAEESLVPVAAELDAARNQYADAKKKLDEATAAKNDAASRLKAKRDVAAPLQEAATAAGKAVKALSDDKELAAAAEKIAARSDQLTKEVTALEKEVAEKEAAVAPLAKILEEAKPNVDAALAKLEPFEQELRRTEVAMLAARLQAAGDAEALAAMEERRRTVRTIAELPAKKQAVVVAKEEVARAEAGLAAVRQDVAGYAKVVEKHESESQQATAALTAATKVLDAARAVHGKQVEASDAIAAAFASARTATQKLPDDSELNEVAAKLESRAAAAQAETAESQGKVDAALAAQQVAGETSSAAAAKLSTAIAEQERRQKHVADAEAALAEAQASVAGAEAEFDTEVAKLVERWSRDFTVASLKPLTPEQLCWSVLRVTGVYDRHWQGQIAEMDKTAPLSEEQQKDPAQVAARNVELEQKTFDQLKGTVSTFVQFFGAAAGQPQGDFFATPDQALFAANGGAINSWVGPAGDNVTERIVKFEDPRAAAEELYLSVLTRFPTEKETGEVAAYLNERTEEKTSAAQELVWGLVNSVEFRFNH